MQKTTLFGLAILLAGCGDGCRNEVFSQIEAPGEAYGAVLFQRDCGATTGFSSQISVLPAGTEPAGAGNAFRADTGHDDAVRTGAWRGPWVEVRWLSPRHLLIRHAAGARLLMRAAEANGIRISHEPVPAPSPARP